MMPVVERPCIDLVDHEELISLPLYGLRIEPGETLRQAVERTSTERPEWVSHWKLVRGKWDLICEGDH